MQMLIKPCAMMICVICRKIYFLYYWKILRHRYDGVLRRLADHRSNVCTNSSDYPCLVENEPARSFQPACSSGSASFYCLALYPAHELMNVYQTNCILFAQTARWSLATTTSKSHRKRGSIKLCGICKFVSIRARVPRAIGRKCNEIVGRVIIAFRVFVPFLLIIS